MTFSVRKVRNVETTNGKDLIAMLREVGSEPYTYHLPDDHPLYTRNPSHRCVALETGGGGVFHIAMALQRKFRKAHRDIPTPWLVAPFQGGTVRTDLVYWPGVEWPEDEPEVE